MLFCKISHSVQSWFRPFLVDKNKEKQYKTVCNWCLWPFKHRRLLLLSLTWTILAGPTWFKLADGQLSTASKHAYEERSCQNKTINTKDLWTKYNIFDHQERLTWYCWNRCFITVIRGRICQKEYSVSDMTLIKTKNSSCAEELCLMYRKLHLKVTVVPKLPPKANTS